MVTLWLNGFALVLHFPRLPPVLPPKWRELSWRQPHARQPRHSVAAVELPACQSWHFGGCSVASRLPIRRKFRRNCLAAILCNSNNLWTIDCRLQTTNHQPRTAQQKSPHPFRQRLSLLTVDYRLLTNDYRLLTRLPIPSLAARPHTLASPLQEWGNH
jgi:hypothetical protein